jgi:hypothetical protein
MGEQYNNGGYIPGGTTSVVLHPDECFLSAEDVLARRWRCSRPGHPTETSDCRPRRHV